MMFKKERIKIAPCVHECHCECHKNPDIIKHPLACCVICDICGKKIKRTRHSNHLTCCHERNFYKIRQK